MFKYTCLQTGPEISWYSMQNVTQNKASMCILQIGNPDTILPGAQTQSKLAVAAASPTEHAMSIFIALSMHGHTHQPTVFVLMLATQWCADHFLMTSQNPPIAHNWPSSLCSHLRVARNTGDPTRRMQHCW